MSRGGWIMIIGGVILLVGIGLFAFGTASLLPNLESTTLSPSEFLNQTVDVREAGSALVYLVQIEQFASGDELTVFIRTPSVEEVGRTTVSSADLFFPSPPYVTTEPGPHMIVIQNTAGQSVSLLSGAIEISFTTLALISAGFILGFAGGIVLIVGIVLWALDRRRQRRQPLEMPPPPT
ncbi:MAG: hypothetical protein ACE5EW_00980 [Thermoplasmata archaeon]